MELVNHEVMKARRDVVGFMPGEIGFPHNTLAKKRRLPLSRIRIAFGSFAAVSHNIKQAALPVAYTGDETAPMAAVVAIEQASVVALTFVKIANDIHRICMGAQMRKVAPPAMRLAPMGVPGWI